MIGARSADNHQGHAVPNRPQAKAGQMTATTKCRNVKKARAMWVSSTDAQVCLKTDWPSVWYFLWPLCGTPWSLEGLRWSCVVLGRDERCNRLDPVALQRRARTAQLDALGRDRLPLCFRNDQIRESPCRCGSLPACAQRAHASVALAGTGKLTGEAPGFASRRLSR